jgi:hypothetical protein
MLAGIQSWGDRVLVKGQNQSDATKGVIDKFMHVYQGPDIVKTILPHSTYEIVDDKGKLRGEFNNRHLKPYKLESDSESHGN